eukprot:53711_1
MSNKSNKLPPKRSFRDLIFSGNNEMVTINIAQNTYNSDLPLKKKRPYNAHWLDTLMDPWSILVAKLANVHPFVVLRYIMMEIFVCQYGGALLYEKIFKSFIVLSRNVDITIISSKQFGMQLAVCCKVLEKNHLEIKKQVDKKDKAVMNENKHLHHKKKDYSQLLLMIYVPVITEIAKKITEKIKNKHSLKDETFMYEENLSVLIISFVDGLQHGLYQYAFINIVGNIFSRNIVLRWNKNVIAVIGTLLDETPGALNFWISFASNSYRSGDLARPNKMFHKFNEFYNNINDAYYNDRYDILNTLTNFHSKISISQN